MDRIQLSRLAFSIALACYAWGRPAAAEDAGDAQPPEPTQLRLPEWLEADEAAPIEKPPTRPRRLSDAFELDGEVNLQASAIPSATAEPAGAAAIASDVQLASANILGDAPGPSALGEVQARAARLAARAKSLGDFNDLVELCQPAIESGDPTADGLVRLAAWAHDRRGELRLEADDPRAAFDDFQRAVMLDPTCTSALNHRGVLLAQHGELKPAIEDFSRAASLAPTDPQPLRNRAEAHAQLGEWSSAIADYNAALALKPEDPALLAARGYAQHAAGKLEAALADLDLAVRLKPLEAEYRTLRGNVYAEAGLYQQAVDDLEQALRLNPNARDAYLSTAWLLATCDEPRFRNPATALEAANRAMKLSGEPDARGLEVLAAALAAVGDYAEAVRHQERAVLLAPSELASEMRNRLALYQRGAPFVSR